MIRHQTNASLLPLFWNMKAYVIGHFALEKFNKSEKGSSFCWTSSSRIISISCNKQKADSCKYVSVQPFWLKIRSIKNIFHLLSAFYSTLRNTVYWFYKISWLSIHFQVSPFAYYLLFYGYFMTSRIINRFTAIYDMKGLTHTPYLLQFRLQLCHCLSFSFGFLTSLA